MPPGSGGTIAQKLTPIIVTEKKIISLKRKGDGTQAQQQPPQRTIPTAKVLPETKKTGADVLQAIVKPVQKTRPVVATVATANNTMGKRNAVDEYDEDELLADSPSSSPTPQSSGQSLIVPSTNTTSGGTNKSSGAVGRFTANRRVVLKTTHATDARVSQQQQLQQQNITLSTSTKLGLDKNEVGGKTLTPSNKSKGIFDRLDRKVNVAESSKRKIQRIIINNVD